MTKICITCKKEKDTSLFSTNNQCKLCRSKYKKLYYIRKSEILKQKRKVYYINNRDKQIKAVNQYQKENATRIQQRRAKYYKKNRDRILKEKHQYYIKHAEQINKRNYEWAKTNEKATWRWSAESFRWKRAIYKKFNHTCQDCGKRGKMCAHHIKSVKEFPELRSDIENGVCLCVECHYKRHNQVYNPL